MKNKKSIIVIFISIFCYLFFFYANSDNDNVQLKSGVVFSHNKLEKHSTDALTQLNGLVTAPGGALAFKTPDGLWEQLVSWVKPNSLTEIQGLFVGAGPGVVVRLFEVDEACNQIGPVLDQALTVQDGSYQMKVSVSLSSGVHYVVEAIGIHGEKLTSEITGANVNLNPVNTAAHRLLNSSIQSNRSQFSRLSAQSILSLQEEMRDLVASPTFMAASTTTIRMATEALIAAAMADKEVSRIVHSLSSYGILMGQIKDWNDQPLSGMRVQLLDYGTGLLRAITRTDSEGRYRMNAPIGKSYAVCVLNTSYSSLAASGCWTEKGDLIAFFRDSESFILGSRVEKKDFSLSPGTRLAGIVRGGGIGLSGMNIRVRDFHSGQSLFNFKTRSDGSFVVNLPLDNTVIVRAENNTYKPFESGYWLKENKIIGAADEATPIQLQSGLNMMISFTLPFKGNGYSSSVSEFKNGATSQKLQADM